MAIDNTPRKTLAANNQLTITCPVFQVETPIASCFRLRDMVWKGQGPQQRQGCQACMAASKCPINGIIKSMFARGTDPYYSAEPKHGALLPEHLALSANVIVLPLHYANLNIPEKELALIQDANERSSAYGNKKRDVEEKRGAKRQAAVQREKVNLDTIEVKRTPKAEPAMASTTAAAIAGDMSAAINAAMSSAAEKPAERPVAPPAPTKPATSPTPPVTGSKPLSLLDRARLAQEAKSA
jgi:hypothetical protein